MQEDYTPPKQSGRLIPPEYLVPFVLITVLFPLWGFANDITNPMVKAFSKILLMSNFEGSLVQAAFYGGYFAMAFPAALFIKRFTYKSGVLMGLGLYATGALLFIPAAKMMVFWPFLVAYFILTCGLSFLETTANPYILSMGSENTATLRLNVAQAFNPLGSLLGMFTAQQLILGRLNPATQQERAAMASGQLEAITAGDLWTIAMPYVGIALVILLFFAIIAFKDMPHAASSTHRLDLGPTLKRLVTNLRYVEGVVAQLFYIGAQITCWTFIIQYGSEVLMARGMPEADAEVAAQGYNIVAMVIFAVSRFICTVLLRYFSPGGLLMSLAIGGFALILGTIFVPGIAGLYCLVAVSACMSLMFPTIYGIALTGLGDDAKIGAAGLIMAILGGSVIPPIQAAIMDMNAFQIGSISLSSVRASFVLPLICFAVVAIFGWRTSVTHLKHVEAHS